MITITHKLAIGLVAYVGVMAAALAHYTYTCPQANDFKWVDGYCVAQQNNTAFYLPMNPEGKKHGKLCKTPYAQPVQMVLDRKYRSKLVIVCHYSNGFQSYTMKKLKRCLVPQNSGGVWHHGNQSSTCTEPGCVLKCWN